MMSFVSSGAVNGSMVMMSSPSPASIVSSVTIERSIGSPLIVSVLPLRTMLSGPALPVAVTIGLKTASAVPVPSIVSSNVTSFAPTVNVESSPGTRLTGSSSLSMFAVSEGSGPLSCAVTFAEVAPAKTW